MEYERPNPQGNVGATSKVCGKCGQEKALDEFHVCRRNLDGRQSWCKECRRAHQASTQRQRRAYLEANKDKLNLKRRAHYAANRQKFNAQQRAYRSTHGQEFKAYMAAYIRRYWVANKDALKAQHQAYRESHRGELNRKAREYASRPEVKERRREYQRGYYRRNAEAIKARARERDEAMERMEESPS
jgi:hypothetical protein